jgi:hypothetical protein
MSEPRKVATHVRLRQSIVNMSVVMDVYSGDEVFIWSVKAPRDPKKILSNLREKSIDIDSSSLTESDIDDQVQDVCVLM